MAPQLMPATLSHWDELLNADAREGEGARASRGGWADLALSFFDDERPLQGAAGLVDWRLHGQLSRLIEAGHCQGATGESLMMPAGTRLPFSRILVFGLGTSPRSLGDRAFSRVAQVVANAMRLAGANSYALQLPGRATGLISALHAAELWAHVLGTCTASCAAHVTLIDTYDACKEMRGL